ncbi:phosphoribosylamine--glycine ligase [bacterium]|nr:phosphoribosylamine--glycine ligase [bacterium]
MNILVIGSGGREHTLVWKLKQSSKAEKIFCIPGNAGIAELAECANIDIADFKSLIEFAKKNNIGLTVVGPEVPLVEGIVDEFEKEGLRIFGPSKEAAQLEGSKVFTKDFLKKYFIPTAEYEVFDNKKDAFAYVQQKDVPIVIKADGLAAGKGVYVCDSLESADKALVDIFDDKIFKQAGHKVVVEECLVGQEASILVFCDGRHGLMMKPSQDHKRIYDNDEGPNTGGMGTYCPASVVTPELEMEIEHEIVIPTLHGMNKEMIPFKGMLFIGIMLTDKGPKVLEYNVRFGDPETQVVLPLLKNDLVEVMEACIDGTLKNIKLQWDDGACVCVVLASGGYPGKYEKGKVISFDPSLKDDKDIIIFHAGTFYEGRGTKDEGREMKDEGREIVTSGGRVLGVTAKGKDIKDAIDKAYKAVNKIKFDGMYYRKDIGKKAL